MRDFILCAAVWAAVFLAGCVGVQRGQTQLQTNPVGSQVQPVPTTVTVVSAAGLRARGATMVIEASVDATGVEGGIDLCKQAIAQKIPCTALDPRTGNPIASIGDRFGSGAYGAGARMVSADRYATDLQIQQEASDRLLSDLSANQTEIVLGAVDASNK